MMAGDVPLLGGPGRAAPARAMTDKQKGLESSVGNSHRGAGDRTTAPSSPPSWGRTREGFHLGRRAPGVTSHLPTGASLGVSVSTRSAV